MVRFTSLGDLILTTPFFREVKSIFPEAKVDFLTSDTFASLFTSNPHINELFTFDRKADSEELNRWASQIKAEKYDLVFDLHRSLRSRLLLLKALGPLASSHIGINKRSLKRNLLLSFGWDWFTEPEPQRLAYLEPLKRFGSDHQLDGHTELFPSPEDHRVVKDILREKQIEDKPLVCLGPSASFGLKCWPQDRFLKLGIALYERGFQPVSLGASADPEPPYLEQASDGKIINLAGKFSFLQSAAFLSVAQLAISNDSAVVHFSEAVGTPALAIFGPTVPQFGYGPFLPNSELIEHPVGCRPCSRNGKGDCKNQQGQVCMEEISVEQVLGSAIKRLT